MAEISFEKALEKLEKIVAELEEGTISLEDALSRYEEGIKMARHCQEKLTRAEKKIEVLSRSAKGELERKPFEMDDDSVSEELPRARKPKKSAAAETFDGEELL